MKTPYVRPEGHVAPERLHRPKRGRSGPCRRRCRSRGGGDGSHAWCDRQARGATRSAREGERRGLNVACRNSFVPRASAPSTAIDRSVRLSTTKEDIRVCGRIGRIGRIGLVHATYQRSTHLGSFPREGANSFRNDPGSRNREWRLEEIHTDLRVCALLFGEGVGRKQRAAPPPSGVVVGARRREGVLGSPSTRGRPRRRQVDGRRSPVAGRGSTVFFKKS